MIRCSASDLATLYARCGNYVEAIGITGRIDTAGMDDSERYRYHNALYVAYRAVGRHGAAAVCRISIGLLLRLGVVRTSRALLTD